MPSVPVSVGKFVGGETNSPYWSMYMANRVAATDWAAKRPTASRLNMIESDTQLSQDPADIYINGRNEQAQQRPELPRGIQGEQQVATKNQRKRSRDRKGNGNPGREAMYIRGSPI